MGFVMEQNDSDVLLAMYYFSSNKYLFIYVHVCDLYCSTGVLVSCKKESTLETASIFHQQA